jgi:hypothetical protein
VIGRAKTYPGDTEKSKRIWNEIIASHCIDPEEQRSRQEKPKSFAADER